MAVLAAQIPRFDQMPISDVMGNVVASPRWSALLGDVDPGYHFNPDMSYYDWFSGPGIEVRMRATEYHHVMDGHGGIIEMMMSTGLRTYLEHFSEVDAPEFIGPVREGQRRSVPSGATGRSCSLSSASSSWPGSCRFIRTP
jgi:trans-aconitate methyltransferase